MKHHHRRWLWSGWFCVLLCLCLPGFSSAEPPTTLEKYALSSNRKQLLQRLVPGTKNYYFYHALFALQQKQWKKADDWISRGRKRFPYDSRFKNLRLRAALVSWSPSSEQRHQQLLKLLKLRFSHEPPIQKHGSKRVPRIAKLGLFSLKSLRKMLPRFFHKVSAYQRKNGNFKRSFKPSLTRILMQELLAGLDNSGRLKKKVTPWVRALYKVRFPLLRSLYQPDLKGLEPLLLAEMKVRGKEFGSLPLHHFLSTEQLNTLAALQPSLRQKKSWIAARLKRWPLPEKAAWKVDRQLRLKTLEGLWNFVSTLPAWETSLKLNILHQLLKAHEALGQRPLKLFKTYLAIPRRASYMRSSYLKGLPARQVASTSQDLRSWFGGLFGRIHGERWMVRRWLLDFYRRGVPFKTFTKTLSPRWLRPLFARARLTQDPGSSEKWLSWLSPTALRQLRREVSVRLLPSNPPAFGSGAPVRLGVELKRVKSLMIKVYRLNSLAYLQTHKSTIPAGIKLTGLKPQKELLVRFKKHPLKVFKHTVDLTAFTRGRGVYLVEFFGGNRRSRALFQRGSLRMFEKTSIAGHVFRLFDEAGTLLKKASIWWKGRQYKTDKDGEILLPYSRHSQSGTLLLNAGELAEMRSFTREKVRLTLQTKLFVSREMLVSGTSAPLMLSTLLQHNGKPAPLSLLKNVRAELSYQTYKGSYGTRHWKGLKLRVGRELILPFKVPATLKSFRLTLRGEVLNVTTGKHVRLSSTKRYEAYSIARTSYLYTAHLRHGKKQSVLEVRDRNGAPVAGVRVRLDLRFRWLNESGRPTFTTDKQGQIKLGSLEGVRRLKARIQGRKVGDFPLYQPLDYRLPNSLNIVAGKPLRLMLSSPKRAGVLSQIALVQMQRDTVWKDHSSQLQWKDGELLWKNPAVGIYTLRYYLDGTPETQEIRVFSRASGGLLMNRAQLLSPLPRTRLRLTGTTWSKQHLTLQWKGVTSSTRVHVLAHHFHDDALRAVPVESSESTKLFSWTPSCTSYLSNRRLADELLYIFQRRYTQKFPGNPLPAPGLLLNPWSPLHVLGFKPGRSGGFGFGGRRGYGAGGKRKKLSARMKTHGPRMSRTNSDYGWIQKPAVLLSNLRPDKDGKLRLPLSLIGHTTQISILGLDQHGETVKVLKRPLQKMALQDLRLARTLPIKQHLHHVRKVLVLSKKKPLSLRRKALAQMKAFSSLAAVFRFLKSRVGGGDFAKFAFLGRWSTLSWKKKLSLYSTYASHELNFFLYRRDKEFFAKVVRPVLQNKWRKTFLDRWLLGMALKRYTSLWEWNRLNTFEKILLARRVPSLRASTLRWLKDKLARKAQLRTVFTKRTILDFDDAKISGELRSPTSLSLRSSDRLKMGVKSKKETPKKERKAEQKRVWEFQKRLQQRLSLKLIYRPLKATRELIEMHYYKVPLSRMTASLIKPTPFWLDVANFDGKGPFVSRHLSEIKPTTTEGLLALALLGLPEKPAKLTTRATKKGVLVNTPTPVVVAFQDYLPLQKPKSKKPLVVRQRFFEQGSGTREVQGTFLRGRAYRAEVLLHNPWDKKQLVSVLLQIPRGAIKLGNVNTTWIKVRSLRPYQTSRLSYSFVFPRTGRFEQYPPSTSWQGSSMGVAAGRTFVVVNKRPRRDRHLWKTIAAEGSLKEVLSALNKRNLNKLNLSLLAWRMKKKTAFLKVTGLLRKLGRFEAVLWSYGFHHKHRPSMQTWLRYQSRVWSRVELPLRSALVSMEIEDSKGFEFKEYRPLVLPRIHSSDSFPRIPNRRLRSQYRAFLKTLRWRAELRERDKVMVIYYLLLQNRIAEAKSWMSKVKAAKLSSQLQWAYLRAYMDFYNPRPALALTLSRLYLKFPLLRWQRRFRSILKEFTAWKGGGSQSKSKTKQQTQTNKEPRLSLRLRDGKLELKTQALSKVTLRYYLMDPETSFSLKPFAQNRGRFRPFVAPHRSESRKVTGLERLSLPKAVQNQNVLIEAVAGNLRRSVLSFSHSLDVQLLREKGRLQVRHANTGKRLSKVYIKVYAKLNSGGVRFVKDGYTDLRGRFDYASVSTLPVRRVKRYAIFVSHPSAGAVVKESLPPGS